MKKTNKPKQEQKPRTPAKRKGVTELTDQDLKQVQGGVDSASPRFKFKVGKDL